MSTRAAALFARHSVELLAELVDESAGHIALKPEATGEAVYIAAYHVNRSITDVAFACGFSDLSHFGRLFARNFGMTPSRWRRMAR